MMQLAFDTRKLEPQSPRQALEEALVWIAENPGAWDLIVEYAYRDAATLGRVRVKRYIEDLRCSPLVGRPNGSPVKLKNGLSAAFGRILRAWHPDIAECVPLAGSKLDGCVVPPR